MILFASLTNNQIIAVNLIGDPEWPKVTRCTYHLLYCGLSLVEECLCYKIAKFQGTLFIYWSILFTGQYCLLVNTILRITLHLQMLYRQLEDQ